MAKPQIALHRGQLYRVRHPLGDPKAARVFVIVARKVTLQSRLPVVACVPVHTQRLGLATEVPVGIAEGLLHDSAIRCDGITSLARDGLTDYVGELSPTLLAELDQALKIALDLE